VLAMPIKPKKALYGAAGAPEFKILTQIIGIDAFADQLRVADDLIESGFKCAHGLAGKVVRVASRVTITRRGTR
jgi:hypothetical protein